MEADGLGENLISLPSMSVLTNVYEVHTRLITVGFFYLLVHSSRQSR